MKFDEIIKNATRAFHKTSFKLKKASPEILIVAGIAGVVTSTVMACKATMKVSGITNEHNQEIEKIHNASDRIANGETVMLTDGSKYTENDVRNDTTILYAHTAIKFVKLYGPAVILGTASIACIVGSHSIMTKRNAALAAAYATIETTFKEYRGHVVERFGKELDRELRYNIKAKEFTETKVDEQTGAETTTTEVVNVANPNEYSDYARFYDDGCTGWTKDSEHNLTFLKMQQAYANEKLQDQGYLFLNDVYKMLGIPVTKAGQCVGWIYDKNNSIGDNYVDFGIYNINREKARDFVNGYERTILLDFNVDGNILDLI